MTCNCLVEVDDVDMTPSGIQTKYVIRYCPIHESAHELLKQLKKVHGLWHQCENNCSIVEAIAKAEAV